MEDTAAARILSVDDLLRFLLGEDTPGTRGDDHLTLGVVRSSFLDFCDREGPLVARFMLRYGADPREAQDATQEAFRRAWELRRRPAAEERITVLEAWLRVQALDAYHCLPRRPNRSPVPTELPAIAGHLRTELRRLPDAPRAVLSFFFDHFTVETIADHMGLDYRGTELHLSDACQQLRNALAGAGQQIGRRNEPPIEQQNGDVAPGHRDGVPVPTELRSLVRAADDALLDHVRATLEMTGTLVALIDDDGTTTDVDADKHAVATIRRRSQARALSDELGYAGGSLDRVICLLDAALRHVRDHPLDEPPHLDLIEMRVRGLIRYLDNAYGLTLNLGRDLHFALALDVHMVADVVTDLDLALGRVGEALWWSLLGHHLEQARRVRPVLEKARGRTTALIRYLDTISVDASGADLSHLERRQLAALAGVIWNRSTVWPAAIRGQIDAMSQELCSGVHRVKGGAPATAPAAWRQRGTDPARRARHAGTPEQSGQSPLEVPDRTVAGLTDEVHG